jgi:chlorobactene glucosyltransferase
LNEWLVSLSSGILSFLVILFFVGLTNLRALRRLEKYAAPTRAPLAAVLVPARNEQGNIRACIESLLAQDYPLFEIIVLDDHSVDATFAILEKLRAKHPALRVLRGKPLPLGWLGKHWACYQLAQATGAELLLFTDADTRHHPHALRNAVAALLHEKADLLTALPRERVESWGEKLIVPLLPWSLFYFLPLVLAQWFSFPPLSATIGQFMLFRRAAYEKIGGYAAVRAQIADDLALGRRIIANGLRWRLLDGSARIECHMYQSGWEAFEGFSKNLFAAFDCHAWLFVPIWTWVGLVFLAPLPLALTRNPFAIADVLLALLLWLIFCRRFQLPLYLTFLYPLTIALAVGIAFRSLGITLLGRGVWKGRVLAVTKSERGA